MDKIELLGGACFSHGPYTFYKAVRVSHGRVLRLGSFFLTKLYSDADLVSIGELQLVWIDNRGPHTPLASLRLYFLPENTPDGRRDTHGEDEVLTISEKVVVRVHDLVTWLSPSLEWSWGREVSYPSTPISSPDSSPRPQVLSDPGLDFSDVERHQKDLEALSTRGSRGAVSAEQTAQTNVVVLSYPRYCRYRALLRRVEGSEPTWLCSSIAAALGGFTALPGTRVLFCRDTFDYPDLETHELLCNHLAPKLKGRPRRKRKKRSVSPCGESSNESEASVASSAAASTSKGSSLSSSALATSGSSRRSSVLATLNDRKPSPEEKKFVSDVCTFMSSRNTPLGKMPLLGYRQIDLFSFYTKVQDLGGYDRVSANRLWKSIYDDMGGNIGSTSAATITRRHYEKLLLPYEKCQKSEDSMVKPNLASRRIKTPSISDASEDSVEVKRENESPPPSETPPPSEANSTVTPPPLQSILSTSPFLPGDKLPRTEVGKTSSLRSVRVKPERLKSLNTIIATSNPANGPASSNPQLPTSPTTMTGTTSSSGASSPTGTPPASTTPTASQQHSVLERQLNSPLITQQVPPSCSPPGLPVSSVATNATTVVTLTPPPEKDMKEIKLDSKQTSLLAQGKENIPLYEEKTSAIFADKPHSPEVIDLETESEPGTRDKLIIPSFKKRKLEILREGGLEVTPVDVDARPSVIQPTTTTACLSSTTTTTTSSSAPSPSPLVAPTHSGQIAPPSPLKQDEKSAFALPPSAMIPKLINVTVTPDIGHMLPRSGEDRQHPVTPVKQQQMSSNGPPTMPGQTSPAANSRVINLGNSNNASLLQLYAAAQVNPRFVPPLLTNGRAISHQVTQSKSMFAKDERTVYGNPKDILVAPKYMPPMLPQPHTPRNPSVLSAPNVRCGPGGDPIPGGVLDLTQKSSTTPERPTYGRPNLEIVRVPVVPRPTPLNLETRPQNFEAHHRSVMNMPTNLCKDMNNKLPPPPDSMSNARKTQFVTGTVATNPAGGYANVLDSRTMATNNLEITLVSPKKSSGGTVAMPQDSPPRNNNVGQSPMPVQRRQLPPQQQPPPPLPPQPQQYHLNGKYPTRLPAEPVSPYTPRKPSSNSSSTGMSHHPVIPNVPNLSHLNASAAYPRPSSVSNYHHMAMEKRKQAAEEQRSKEQLRRISEGDKLTLQQQQHQRLEGSKQQQSRDSEQRRHSVPSLPTGFIPAIPSANPAFLAHHLAVANNGSSPAAAAAAAAAAATGGKFLPMIDPMYYSSFYNGLFPGPMPPGTPFLTPELSAYYKELLASSPAAQQTRLAAMAASQQHQPAAPTSK